MDKKKLIGAILGILAFAALITGATFAYFSASATNNKIIAGNTSETSNLELTITKMDTATGGLIPMYDNLANKGIANSCIDSNGSTVCHVYDIEIKNGKSKVMISGNINFTSYSNSNIVYDIIFSDIADGASSEKDLDDLAEEVGTTTTGTSYSTPGVLTSKTSFDANEIKHYYLVVWLHDTNNAQQATDAGKENAYTGTVIFNAVDGSGNNSGVTATFTTEEENPESYTTGGGTPVSFATDDWATIAANTTSSVYQVGDTREITLTGFTNEEEGSNGKYTIRIANKSTPSECSTEGFSQTACGFVIEFVDIITEHEMNSTGTNAGGWPESEMYSYLNQVSGNLSSGTIYNALPSNLQNVIIDTTVVSGHGNSNVDSSNFTSTDKLYLLSAHEVWEDVDGDTSSGVDYYDTAYNNTRQLDYYNGQGITADNTAGAIKKLNGTASDWWLRGASPIGPGSFYHFLYVRSDTGDWERMTASRTYGVLPAFRIG